MRPAHRIISVLLAVLLVLVTSACKNKKEINAAKGSVYDTDFALVYSAALDAVRDQYSNLDDNPTTGMIKTAWHQVAANNDSADVANQQTVATSSPGTTAGGATPTRLAYKRQFIRFDVSVIGGRPWRVKVVGKAAEWDPGNAMPTELHGMAKPPWLDGRIESLQVAIYRRLKPYGVPAPKEQLVEKDVAEVPKTDPKSFSNVPAGAAKQLAAIKDALVVRDYVALRVLVAEDVIWSLGAEPGAETAMAMWQADAESLDAMGKVIAGGCGVQAGKVLCPAATTTPGQFQLTLGQVGTTWKVTSFLRAE